MTRKTCLEKGIRKNSFLTTSFSFRFPCLICNHQQTPAYVKALMSFNESSTAGKTLIKVGPTEFAEAGQVGVQRRAGFPKPGMGQAC